MLFLQSAFLGAEGTYNIIGIEVKFLPHSTFNIPTLNVSDPLTCLANKCFKNSVFNLISLGNLHVFVHEMGHALAYKILTGVNTRIEIQTSGGGGATLYPGYIFGWKKSIIAIAGPMSDILFSTCMLVAAKALTYYISWPVALVWGISSALWITGEALYCLTSAIQQDGGDFAQIARNGNGHLLAASALIIAQCALAVFVGIRL